jgi:hypothetical protein
MSRGGRNAYTWATANPDKVSCIYADNPAVSQGAIAALGALAKADVPVLHVCGSIDPILGNHTLVVENIYQQLGGRISVMIKDGVAHHPHSLRDPKPIADFIEQPSAGRGRPPPSSAIVHENFLLRLRERLPRMPSEKTFAACRGLVHPATTATSSIDGIRMPARSSPENPAPGKPWVFRADFVPAMPWSISLWVQASTLSQARCRPTPTGPSWSSGTPSINT